MPAVPIVEQITLALLDALDDIESWNGYDVTLDVQRAAATGNVSDPSKVTCVAYKDDPTDREDIGGGATTQSGVYVDEPFQIELTAYESEQNDFPPRHTLGLAASAVHRRLKLPADRSNGTGVYGVAGVYLVSVGKPAWKPLGEGKGAADSCIITVTVSYRHLLHDPELVATA